MTKSGITPKQAAWLDRVLKAFDETGNLPVHPEAIARLLSVPVQSVDAIIPFGIQSGGLIAAGNSFFISENQMTNLVNQLTEQVGSNGFGIRDFRTRSGLSRSLCDSLFELLTRCEVILETNPGNFEWNFNAGDHFRPRRVSDSGD